ncbi:hypothetical protein MHK_006616, partial [Candidatus Magnetomorum sp. HK-1]
MGSVVININKIQLKNKNIDNLSKINFLQKGFCKIGINNIYSNDLSKHQHIKKLREVLWLPKNISAKTNYPKLDDNDLFIPGYLDFLSMKGSEVEILNPKTRLSILQKPWKEWFSFPKGSTVILFNVFLIVSGCDSISFSCLN